MAARNAFTIANSSGVQSALKSTPNRKAGANPKSASPAYITTSEKSRSLSASYSVSRPRISSRSSLRAAPAVLAVDESDPSVQLKSSLQFRKLIEIQCHCKVNVPGMPRFSGEMHLVSDGPDDNKVCSKHNAMVAERAQISDLVLSQIEHHSDRYSRLNSSAAS